MGGEQRNTILIFCFLFLIGNFSGCTGGENPDENIATEVPAMTAPATQPPTEEPRIETTPPTTEAPESGVVLENNEEMLLIFTDQAEHTERFKLTDVSTIEYVEVTVDARVTPKGYNDYADGINGLLVQINGELPTSGEYAMPDSIEEILKGSVMQEEFKKYPGAEEMFFSSVWYAPSHLSGSLGSSGVRTLRFDKTVLMNGDNILYLKSLDGNPKPNEGDGIFLYKYSVFVEREGKAPQATEPPKTKTVLIEETDPSFTWSDECVIQENPGASGGSWLVCPDEGQPPAIGATVNVTFTGTEVSLLYLACSWCGIAKVEIDGNVYPEIDMYSAEPKAQVKTKIADDLSNTQHTLALVVSNAKNADSDSYLMAVDAIDVTTLS